MLDPRDLQQPPALAELRGQGPISLFLDFDGTLVELADLPTSISVPDRLGARLEELADRLSGRLALVSGRSLPDLQSFLGNPALARAGSHGLARTLADGAVLGEAPESLPEGARTSVEEFAVANRFVLERKPHGVALHYRTTPGLESAGLEFAEHLARLHGLQMKRGSCVIELVSRDADKGRAVRAFMDIEPFAGSRPVFIGDDITDEDGFAAVSALGGFGIIVGHRQPTAATHRLANVSAVHSWLGL